MKKKYLTPATDIVELSLKGSVLEDIGVGAASKETGWDAAAKGNSFAMDEEEDEADGGLYPKFNVWDEE